MGPFFPLPVKAMSVCLKKLNVCFGYRQAHAQPFFSSLPLSVFEYAIACWAQHIFRALLIQGPSTTSGRGCLSLLPAERVGTTSFGFRPMYPPLLLSSAVLSLNTLESVSQHTRLIPHSLRNIFTLFSAQPPPSYVGKGSHLTFCFEKGKVLLKGILHSIKKRKIYLLETLVWVELDIKTWGENCSSECFHLSL